MAEEQATYDGEHCPKCGADIQVVDSLTPSDATTAYQEVRCSAACGQFTEVWQLVRIEQYDPDKAWKAE